MFWAWLMGMAVSTQPDGPIGVAESTPSAPDVDPRMWVAGGTGSLQRKGKARRRGHHSPGTRARRRWKARKRSGG